MIRAVGPDIDSSPLPGGHPLSLRSTALWYPSISSPDLHLNDESLTGELPCTSMYQPLIWTQFAGLKGTNLYDLTELRLNSSHELVSLEFDYMQVDRRLETIKVGRHDMTEWGFGWDKTQTLPIHGPSGEYIERVYANTQRPYLPVEESLYSVKVSHISDNLNPKLTLRSRSSPTLEVLFFLNP